MKWQLVFSYILEKWKKSKKRDDALEKLVLSRCMLRIRAFPFHHSFPHSGCPLSWLVGEKDRRAHSRTNEHVMYRLWNLAVSLVTIWNRSSQNTQFNNYTNFDRFDRATSQAKSAVCVFFARILSRYKWRCFRVLLKKKYLAYWFRGELQNGNPLPRVLGWRQWNLYM